jgi:MFS family permease
MSADASVRRPDDVSANAWLIALLVALATFMEVLDTTIANVALRYIAGGLGVSEDEASWVVTTYLVANAIILTASAFLANKIGRRTFFLGSLTLYTVSSVLCGLAWNLPLLLLFRIIQGFAGGGWCRSRPRSSSMRSRRQSAARPSRCSVWPSWWPRSSGRHWVAGSPTMSPGTGASWSMARSAHWRSG